MSKCGQVVEEGGGQCVNVHTCVYLYIHIHTHIYSTPNDPAPPHKILENAVFFLKVCLTNNLKVCPLDR